MFNKHIVSRFGSYVDTGSTIAKLKRASSSSEKAEEDSKRRSS